MRRNAKDGQQSIPIRDLFAVYKKRLRAPQKSVIKEVVVCVETVTQISVREEWFTYNVSSRTIVYRGPSAVRSELQLHKRGILNKVKESLGEKNTPLDFV